MYLMIKVPKSLELSVPVGEATWFLGNVPIQRFTRAFYFIFFKKNSLSSRSESRGTPATPPSLAWWGRRRGRCWPRSPVPSCSCRLRGIMITPGPGAWPSSSWGTSSPYPSSVTCSTGGPSGEVGRMKDYSLLRIIKSFFPRHV